MEDKILNEKHISVCHNRFVKTVPAAPPGAMNGKWILKEWTGYGKIPAN